MKQADVERLRQKLDFQRDETRQFLRRMEQEAQSLNADTTQDSADRCVISLSKEALFERSSQRRTVLHLIEAALKRIADGSFGTCVGCSDEIQDQRLQALPWTQFCLRCQGELEEKIGASLSTRTPIPAIAASRRAG
jgi:DnaK suppressor protein